VDQVVNVVGDYFTSRGIHLESVVTRLSTTPRSEQEGLRVELSGGRDPLDKKTGVKQKAVIDFLCNKDVDGTETETPEGSDKKEERSISRRADDVKKQPLVFKSYGTEKDPKSDEEWGVLRLDWNTKHACEDSINEDKSDGTHWGFFTWFIIV
jgi:hypothetical protein